MSASCPICTTTDTAFERRLYGHTLNRCRGCSFVFALLAPELCAATNSGYSDDAALFYHSNQSYIDRAYFYLLAASLTWQRGGPGRVLEVGCGNGLLCSALIESGWDVVGCDISPWAQKPAQRYGYRLLTSPLEELPQATPAFDLIISTSTFEHVPAPRQHLSAALKWLVPGGQVYFSGMPNYASLAVRLGLADFRYNSPPGHVNYFSPKSLAALCRHQELSPNIGSYQVSSYGIPELHRLYRALAALKPKATAKPAAPVAAVAQWAAFSTPEPLTTKQQLTAYPIVAIYQLLGCPWQLGSKLTLVVKK